MELSLYIPILLYIQAPMDQLYSLFKMEVDHMTSVFQSTFVIGKLFSQIELDQVIIRNCYFEKPTPL